MKNMKNTKDKKEIKKPKQKSFRKQQIEIAQKMRKDMELMSSAQRFEYLNNNDSERQQMDMDIKI